MSRSLSIAVVAALFLSGVAIGALGMHLYYWERSGPGFDGPPMSPWLSGWMARELDLSVEQRRQIEEILEASRRRSAEIRQEVRPRVEALMTETSQRIAQVLTEEQRRRFEQLQRRQRHRFERGLLGPPGGPPHGRPPGPPSRDGL